LKNRNRFNFKEASNYLALYFLILSIVLVDCTCRKYVHNAETRQLPKFLVIKTNIGAETPELKLLITVSFYSLPEDWYCKHYGSGDGTKPWYIEEKIRPVKLDGPILVPLRLRKATYCPYVLKGVFISFFQGDDSVSKATISIRTKSISPSPSDQAVPEILDLEYQKDSSGYFFPNYAKGLLSYLTPYANTDTITVNVSLKNIKARGK
jgi:hypothetical protein